jgi:hypothetical protein
VTYFSAAFGQKFLIVASMTGNTNGFESRIVTASLLWNPPHVNVGKVEAKKLKEHSRFIGT